MVDASIHGEYTSNVPLWQWMAAYAQEKKLGMHVHVSETQSEHEACKERWGKTPLQILDRYGVWDTRAIAAHCVWTTEEDWALMAEKGVSCIHNPVSNLKLGSGVAWIPAMKRAGVNIALGTDGVSSNNNHDMFEEMKFAAILHNGVTHDPLALLPRQVLAMATRDGARALGRRTGQIAPGYTADLILVDFDRPSLTPLPQCGGQPGLFRPGVRRGDEYGPGKDHIQGWNLLHPGPGADQGRGGDLCPAPALWGRRQPCRPEELTFERTNAEKQHIFRRGGHPGREHRHRENHWRPV